LRSSKERRLAEFFRRLAVAPAATSFEEAYRLLCDTLNAVEDELTDIPFAPEHWETDGRLYPPQDDNARPFHGSVRMMRYRTRGHYILIAANGAIEIRNMKARTMLSKAGSDGRSIKNLEISP